MFLDRVAEIETLVFSIIAAGLDAVDAQKLRCRERLKLYYKSTSTLPTTRQFRVDIAIYTKKGIREIANVVHFVTRNICANVPRRALNTNKDWKRYGTDR